MHDARELRILTSKRHWVLDGSYRIVWRVPGIPGSCKCA